MRRYDIVLGILGILSIIDFALAAPVQVQEKRLACVDAVQISKDVTAILGKRGGEELEKLVAETFDTTEKPVESSDAHASSSSQPPGFEHMSPNPASPPANPEPLMESSTPSPKDIGILTLIPEEDPTESDIEFMHKSSDFDSDSSSSDSESLPLITSWKYSGSEPELKGAHMLESNPNKRPSTGPDPDFDWDYWMNAVNEPLPKRPKLASLKEFGQAHEDQEVNGPQPSPEPLADSHFDMTELFGPDDLLPSLVDPSSNRFDQVHEHEMVHMQQPNPGTSNRGPSDPRLQTVHVQQPNPGTLNQGPSDPRLQTEPGNGVVTPEWPNLPMPDDLDPEVPRGRRPTPELTDPELHSDHQLLSTEISPADVLAAIYEVKGKAIQSRRIPSTARDVGNALAAWVRT